MSFAFLPLYTGDYRRDTQHLTPLKHGVYLLLLMAQWDTGNPIPIDEQEAAGIANCRSADEVEALRYILGRFFIQGPDGYYSRRMQIEIERANAISIKRKSAGAKGYQAKAKQLLSKSLASATTLTPTLTTTTTPRTRERQSPVRLRATRLPPDWQLPDDWKAWAVTVHHLDPPRVVRISLAFRDFWIAKPGAGGCKLDWLATWRNWIRKETEDA